MSFIDMAHLRKKDLQNGILSYSRSKNTPISVNPGGMVHDNKKTTQIYQS